MSFWDHLFDSEWQQREDIEALRRQLAENFSRGDARRAFAQMAAENSRLRLYIAALGRLLVAKGIVSVQEITAALEAVDTEDGKADGQLTGRQLPGEKPQPVRPPTVKKPVGKAPQRPPGQPLAPPPPGWKPKT